MSAVALSGQTSLAIPDKSEVQLSTIGASRFLKSVFLSCKHVIPHMEAGGGGAIVNTASTSGLRWTGSAQAGYAASRPG